MKKLIYILLLFSFMLNAQHETLLLVSQEQYKNETPPTPFDDYYNLVVDFGSNDHVDFKDTDGTTDLLVNSEIDWVHPSVIYFENGWNGHNYWMAITAYPNTVATFEDPYLFYSDDGQTWVTPVGTPKPLHQEEGDTDYLSDTYIMMEGSTMHIFNRGSLTAGGSFIEYVSTTDGVNFTSRQRITRSGIASTTDYVSPSVFLLGGTWYIFCTDVSSTSELAVLTSTSLTGTFTEAHRIDSNIGAVWHSEVHYNADDTTYYIIGTTGGISGGDLVFGKFTNPLTDTDIEFRNTFLIPRNDQTWNVAYYKSSFIIKDNTMELYLGGKGALVDSSTDWRVQKVTTSRLSPTLDLSAYTQTESYPLADVANGFTSGLKDTGYNKMALQFTIVDADNFDVQVNRSGATSYLAFKNVSNTLYFENWQSGQITYDPIVYGVKVDDVVTIIRDEANYTLYVNGNQVYQKDISANGNNYRGTFFGDFANNGSIKDLVVYKRPEWIYDASQYDTDIAALFTDSGSNASGYILVDQFNRASLGTTDDIGNTYTIVGTPSIDSSTRLLSGNTFNILGMPHSETNYDIYLKPDPDYKTFNVFLNYTDNDNCRYIYFKDFGGTVLWIGTYDGGVYSEVEVDILKNYNTGFTRFHFEVRGDDLLIYGDNVHLNTYTLPTIGSAKFVGVSANYSSRYIDEIIVKKQP